MVDNIVSDKKKNILVVDDEQDILQLIQRIFHKNDIECILEDTGQGALDTFKMKHKEIDLIVLDLILPDKDCLQLLQDIWEVKVNQKVLLISGLIEDQEVAHLKMTKPVDFMEKPFKQEDLVEKIKSFWNR